MDSFRRHVRRLIHEPDPFPFVFDLPQVFRVAQEFHHAAIRVARIGIDQTARIREGQACQGQKHKYAPHLCSPVPKTLRPRNAAEIFDPPTC